MGKAWPVQCTDLKVMLLWLNLLLMISWVAGIPYF